MMLSTYERKDSPWVWISFSDPVRGNRRLQKTAVRKDDPDKARKLALEKNRLEAQILTAAPPDAPIEARGWGWCFPWLRSRYAARGATLAVYMIQWTQLERYLADHGVESPAQLTRDDCYAYVAWRRRQVKQKSRHSPGTNTAIGELKLLGMLMKEAVKRGMAAENPASALQIEREEHDLKPEITAAEEEEILEALKTRPLWMLRSFRLAIATGLRFAETRLARNQVRWADEMIVIGNPKGGRGKAFAIPIYPAVRPLLEEWRAEKNNSFLDVPDGTLTGLEWSRVLAPFKARFEKPCLCFHSTRVTFITRGMRAGIPESVMCRMVNHGSTLINRIYQRWTTEDVRRYAALLNASPAQPE